MTMPVLIGNYQKKTIAAQLKESYSILNQALQMAVLEHGEVVNWDFSNPDIILHDYIAANIKSKKYKSAENAYGSGMCFDASATTYKFLDGRGAGVPMLDKIPSIKLINGVCIGLNRSTKQEDGIGPYDYLVFIDVNGSQNKPNVYGKDMFIFQIGKNGEITPFLKGMDIKNMKTCTAEGCCNKNAKYGGTVCSAVIMADGWEMKEDYPW